MFRAERAPRATEVTGARPKVPASQARSADPGPHAETHFGHDFSQVRTSPPHSDSTAPIQRKAQVGDVDDPLEREADEVAERVVRMDEPVGRSAVPAGIRRMQATPPLSVGKGRYLDADLALGATERGGAPLTDELRGYFEPRFGHDLSRVRVHTDGDAAKAANSVQARAYTAGSGIVFASGEYAPATTAGRRLLAHELVHVLQQRGGTVPSAASVVQRQPAPPVTPAGLDAGDQQIVDAAKRETANFKCNVAPVLWGILRKYFPGDVRKIAGTGCETGLPGLRTEFSTTDPKDPKMVRSVPILYAGKAFLGFTDEVGLRSRVKDVATQIGLIDDWRVDQFRIDGKDLSNPRVTGRLRSLSNSELIDYRDKVGDSDVKTFVENLATFSTPTQSGAAIDPLTGKMGLKAGKVNVVIEPDVRGVAGLSGAETGASVKIQPPTVPGFSFDAKNIVTEFPGYDPSVTVTVVTRYGAGTKPEGTSGYGRGTIPEDKQNRATSIRFHEGTHGEDFIDFVRRRPFPVFEGKLGDTRKAFEAAKTRFTTAQTAWAKELNQVNKKGDCVGKTIDEFHKGEKGYTPICP